ncbi:MAG: PorT family protein [Bacteroidota bacterium]|nr:PorT family protein [Bacteroidota bacterium]
MKKALLTLALAAGIASAQAQTNTIGIKAAYGITSLSGTSPGYSSVSHSAYQAGLMGDLFLADVVSIHPELLYTKQYFDATDLANKSRDIDYINLPVTVRYHADGLYFEAGPEVNFALTAKNENGDDVKSRDVTPVVLDYVVGLGYELKSGLSANIRYDGGISHTYKTAAANDLGTGSLRASTFWFGLGYAFGGSK